MPSDLAKRIRAATLKSLSARNRYSDQVTAQLTRSLNQAEKEVARAILQYRSLGSLPDNKLAALKGLEKLQAELADIMRRLKREHTLVFRKSTKEAFRLGIGQGIGELAEAALPFYADLTPAGIDKLAAKVFTLVDTNALDFMTQYNLTLAGDIHRELSDGIKRTILNGIATGKGADDIVRDLGKVIVDKESFRQAGTRVFSKAQYRMEMIARTEVLRAHNMGRLKFHERAGVQKLEWLAMEDERMCPVCGGLDGKTYPIDKFPQQPAHPHCRCSNIITWPMAVCGSSMTAKAAPQSPQGDACILPPQALEGLADDQAEENAKLKKAFESGGIADLNTLTVKQLQTLAKGNGVAVARTKADFIKLLDAAEAGIDHSDLAGAALTAKLKEHKIGLLRTKEELVELLGKKQAELKQAKLLAQQMAKIPPADGLSGMTSQQLKQMAKENGISLNMTKQETIELLDKLEPGIDHSGLAGKELAAVKKKHGIGVLKNKQQLIEALQKKAGADMAESAKKKALDGAKQQLIQKQKSALEEAAKAVVVPENPTGYSGFLQSIVQAEKAVAAGADLPHEMLTAYSKEIVLKKQLFSEQIAKLKSTDLKTIAKETKLKHWQWANKDELVTLFTETDPAKIKAAKESIEAKHAAWAGKHGGKKVSKQSKPKPAPLPKAVQPTAPVFQKKGTEFEEADTAWLAKGNAKNFSTAGKANVGGAHAKEFWTDDKGERWLFKPVGKSGDEFIAYGEEVAYKIGRLIDPQAIEVRTIRLNGRLGSFQKWRTDLKDKFDFAGIDPSDLTTLEIEQIQREQIIDWLISNHDGHAKQFLRAKDGKIYGIDKGQIFKHLGEDRLAIDYHPNARCGEQEPYYNTLFRAAKQGEVKVDPAVALRYIREVEKIADDDYLDLLRPYVEGRFGRDESRKQAFYQMAMARKRNLRRDFEGFYADISGRSGFRFDDVPAALPKSRLGAAEEELLEEVQSLGWQGKVLPFDEDAIEDQNALIFVETMKGRQRTVIKMKVRPKGEARLLEALRKAGVDTATARVGEQLPQDVFAQDILAAVKTINHHAQDNEYNQTTLKKAVDHLKALKQLAGSDDPDVRAMAKAYTDWIEKAREAAGQKKPISGRFDPYLKQFALKEKKSEKTAFSVRRTKVMQPRRELKNGKIVVADDAADNTSLFRGRSMKTGEQYEIDFGDGTRAVYRPWSDKNLYAQQGELELILAQRPDARNIDKAMGHMESIGLKANVASPQDAELLYLHKQAYLAKVESEPEYKKLMEDLDRRAASKEERIRETRGYWERRLGVKDLTRIPGYDPMGEYQGAFKDPAKRAGYRHQYRFDLSDEDIEKKMKGYSLHHRLTNGEDMTTFIETVLDNNGAMLSTIEKVRAGVPVGGMSPEADMDTGGASYFFTRIKKLPTAGGSPDKGLYFKKQMLRRMDAISYDHDAFGRVRDDYVSSHRGSTPEQWKQFAKRSGNETIFKYSVTLLDNIEMIVVGSEREKQRLLEVFGKQKIARLPDGRKVEDIVLVR